MYAPGVGWFGCAGDRRTSGPPRRPTRAPAYTGSHCCWGRCCMCAARNADRWSMPKIYTYIHTYTDEINTYIHTYIHTYIQGQLTWDRRWKSLFIHTYVHTYIFTYIHTYTHISIKARISKCLPWGCNTRRRACLRPWILPPSQSQGRREEGTSRSSFLIRKHTYIHTYIYTYSTYIHTVHTCSVGGH